MLHDTLPRAAMKLHRIASIRTGRIVPQARISNCLPRIILAIIIRENIERVHAFREISPVDTDVVLGVCYLDAGLAVLVKVLRWAGLLRADAVLVGCDTGVGVLSVGREGGGHGESAGAQCEEDE